MTIDVFVADTIDFRANERKQYERIKKSLIAHFSNTDNRYCLIVDYIIGNKQYDLILITNDSIIIIDIKGYKGKVIGSENGKWYVEKDGETVEIKQPKNPYLQMRDQRYELMSFLNASLPKISKRFKDNEVHNISAFLCFEEGSIYMVNQIDFKKSPWFNVVDESSLVDEISKTTSNEFYLKDLEIDRLMKYMKLQKIDEPEPVEITEKGSLHSQDVVNITKKIISSSISVEGFTFKDLSSLFGPEIAARYIEYAEELGIIEKIDDGKFSFTDDWSDNLPEISDESQDILPEFSKEEFWLFPKKLKLGETYPGVYRGTKFHINSKGEVWWKSSGGILLKAEFSDKTIIDEILKYKPSGGAFRITESKEILTKRENGDGDYTPIYIAKFQGDIKLDSVEWAPKVKKGELWPSKYDGVVMSVNSNGRVAIKIGKGVKVYAKSGHEKLAREILSVRPIGGRFVIDENKNVLTLVEGVPYPEKIEKQMKKLTDEEKNIIEIRNSFGNDGMVPIYVGKFTGNILFNRVFDIHREWTKEEDEEFLKRLGVR